MHKISLHRTTVPCVQTALVFVGTLLSPAAPMSAAESPSVSSFALAAPRPPGQFVYGTHLWHEGQRGMSRQLYRTLLVPNSPSEASHSQGGHRYAAQRAWTLASRWWRRRASARASRGMRST